MFQPRLLGADVGRVERLTHDVAVRPEIEVELCAHADAREGLHGGPGERLDVDTGCVMAFHDTVSMDVRTIRGIKSMMFGGEGMFLATLTGPATTLD